MQGNFRHLHFKTFPMTPRTPQCEVFWPLLSNSEHSEVPEDSKSPTSGVLGFTPTLGQSGVATTWELTWECESSCSHSLTLLLAHTFANLCLGRKPKARFATTNLYKKYRDLNTSFQVANFLEFIDAITNTSL